jgi:hypothetical protein
MEHTRSFLCFGALKVFCGLFVLIWVKETKGVPLEMVPALFTRGGIRPCDKDSEGANANEAIPDPMKNV